MAQPEPPDSVRIETIPLVPTGAGTDDERSIRVLTIDRPDVRNAVDGPTASALYDAFTELDRDPAIAAAVLTGADGTFCSGADLGAISDGRGNPVREEGADAIVGSIGPMGPTRLDLDTPVIAAIEGYAVAGGLELALWCDLRVVARDASFGVFCRRWGVPLIDGGTIRLPRLIGESRAADLILTGREVGAQEALAIGLANRVTEPGRARDDAVELARQIAHFPPRCVRNDRRSMREQAGRGLGEALAREVALGMDTIRSGETTAGARRFADGAGRHGAPDD